MSTDITQGAIDVFASKREALRQSNPFWYWFTGGDRAATYTAQNLGGAAKVQKAADTVAETVTGTFDIVAWIKENWQLAILGVVALLVLLKD